RQEHDEDHTPDREERIADGVGDGVAERGNLALRDVADEAERRRRSARSGHRTEDDRVVDPEKVLPDEQPEDYGHRGRHRAPQEQSDALRLQAVDEPGASRDADDRNEDVETYRIHEPHGRGRNPSEVWARRAEPSEHESGNEGTSRGR